MKRQRDEGRVEAPQAPPNNRREEMHAIARR